MDERKKICEVLGAILNSFNMSEMIKLKQQHENGWKEYLNGNRNSQLAADQEMTKVITDLVNGLEPVRVKYILDQINK